MKSLIGMAAAFGVLGALPAHAQDGATSLSVSALAGVASAGAELRPSGGGSAIDVESDGKGAIGAQFVYDLTRPAQTGFRTALDGHLLYHKIRASQTDATLGAITLENNYSGALRGRLGYDFGTLYPYAALGLGFSDVSVGTNGAAPKDRFSVGPSIGFGVEADFGNGWAGQFEMSATPTTDFTPAGGGAKATAGTAVLHLGLTGRF